MAAKTNSKYEHLIDESDKTEDGSIPDTHRAYDTFPHGEPCELTITDLPDEETDYGWTTHYEDESRHRSNPDVTQELIDELLTTGAVWEATGDSDRYLIQKKMDGYEWTMVVADDGDVDAERWVIITIYSNYHGSTGVTNRYFDRKRQEREAE